MPATPVKASELRFGLEASPGFQGNRLAPFKIEEIELNGEGRAELRKGYIVSEQEFEGSGDQLIVAHFVGDRESLGKSLYERVDTNDSHAMFGKRLFLARASGNNIWIDMTTLGVAHGRSEYDWELVKPTVKPTIEASFTKTGILSVSIFPNPITTEGTIQITVGGTVSVRVRILDVAGDTVRNLIPLDNDVSENPNHSDYYDISNGTYEYQVRGLAAGVYVVNILYLDGNNEVSYDVDTLASSPVFDDDSEPDVEQITDLGDLSPGDGTRGGNYLICYTYASAKHGIETPPSPFEQYFIARNTLNRRSARVPIQMNISNYTSQVPEWADEIRFYAKRVASETHFSEPKDIPFDFQLIHVLERDNLSINFRGFFIWDDEELYEPFGYLETKEFETSPDIHSLESIISYAGRIWGYDRSLHSIRFSHIERPDVMPYEDARIPHAVRIDGSWQARVQAMHVMPSKGGIYVFFPRAIRTILGQQIVTGIFQLSISPETDIDASGGVNGKGTVSPNTIVSFGSITFYLDTDRRVYSLGGEHSLNTEEFSLSIQPFLDEATDREIREARAEVWQSRYHLMLADKTYILDMQRNYWTIWNVPITSILHSVGGDGDEDILYALVNNQVVELYQGDAPDGTEWLWVTNYLELPRFSRISEVILPHPENEDVEVEMRIETERGISDWQHYEVGAGNKFRLGTFAQADTRVRAYIRGRGEIPRFNELHIGLH